MNRPTDESERHRFLWPVRVYYEDTDAGGVVYYANYLRFLERARTERLRSVGYEQDELRETEGIVFAVRSVTVDYLKPALFNDLLLVSAELAEVKRVSMLFAQTVVRAAKPADCLCQARVRVVCLDTGDFKPRAIPDKLLQRMKDDP